MKKTLALILSALMLVSLFAGCGKDNGESKDPGADDATISKTEAAGTLTVNGAAIMSVTYGADGLVIKVEGLNDDGVELLSTYEDMMGTTCAEVVEMFIKDCFVKNYMFDTNYVVVKQDKDAALPGTSFLENIKTAAENALKAVESSAALVMITEENLNEEGYINPATAKVLVEKYLQVEKVDNFDGPDKPTDGMYSFRVGYDSMNEVLEVNALDGSVTPGVIAEEEIQEEEEGHTPPTESVDDTPDADDTVELPEDTTPAA